MNPGSHAPQACILIHQPKKSPKIQGFLGMLDDGPADLALQEYEDKIINTLEEITANGLSPRALIIRSFSSNLSTPTKLASETENLSTQGWQMLIK